jgi:hypothetical protein
LQIQYSIFKNWSELEQDPKFWQTGAGVAEKSTGSATVNVYKQQFTEIIFITVQKYRYRFLI